MTSIRKYLLAVVAILLVLGFLVAAAYFVDFPIPANMDFITIYTADSAWVRGIDIYDHDSQVDMLANQNGLDPESINLPYYVYPPWYVFATLFLVWFPIEAAAKLWFFINVGLISGAVWLLTLNWKVVNKIFAQIFTFTFLPTMGLLAVGQYTAPVFLGISLLIYAIKKRIVWMAVLGLLLLTFKPHVGIIILVVVTSWMVLSQTDYARRLILPNVISGCLLIIGSFILDPTWVSDYVSTLNLFRNTASEVQCEICISLPMALVDLVTGKPYTSIAIVIGGLSFLVAWYWFIRHRDELQDNPWFQISLASAITVLIIPNVRNYDYILLLVPLFYLWQNGTTRSSKIVSWVVWSIAFIAPWVALLIAGKLAVGVSLLSTGLVIFLITFFHHGLDYPVTIQGSSPQ